jgi:hypothetical protein
VTEVLYGLKNLSIKNACMPAKEEAEISGSASMPIEEDVTASEESEEKT